MTFPPSARASTRAGGALAVFIALAGCGEIRTPDMSVGAVRGRIEGAREGAYAYAFGRPDLRAPLTPDGFFQLVVPVETREIVLVDVGDEELPPEAEAARAERIPVAVKGADVIRIPDRHGERSARPEAERMPLAGVVAATVRPEGWAALRDAWFALDGTDREGVGAAGVLLLGRLPPGPLGITARMAGFGQGWGAVDVAAGATVGYEVLLPIAGDGPPGCAATGGCPPGLVCGSDGRCAPCAADAAPSGCGAGEVCDPVLRLCAAAPGAGAFCARCVEDADCASYACTRSGSGTSADAGYCSAACGPYDACPAGLACEAGRCRAPEGCAAYLGALWARCASQGPSICAGPLAGGFCAGWGTDGGYCAAPCATDEQCAHIGPGPWVCAPGLGACVPSLYPR